MMKENITLKKKVILEQIFLRIGWIRFKVKKKLVYFAILNFYFPFQVHIRNIWIMIRHWRNTVAIKSKLAYLSPLF